MISSLEQDGYQIIPQACLPASIDQAINAVSELLQDGNYSDSIQSKSGQVVGARNLLDVLPLTRSIWMTPSLMATLEAVLGRECGLVRVLYFDKPPGASWVLPWHQDRTIAVKDNRITSDHFTKPTTKSGVPHIEAPRHVLENMLTFRLHLDAMTDRNGPLVVIPGSHVCASEAEADQAAAVTIHADQGDVLAMRPLLSHSSKESDSSFDGHRRILHFEFAAHPSLDDGFEWQTFIPAFANARDSETD